MTEVLLFNQYFTSKKEPVELIPATLPVNLLALASYLKEKNINCKIYELGIFDLTKIIIERDRIRCGISDDEITKIIENENPKIVGIGCMYSIHYTDVISITRLIKAISKDIKIVLGGNHATTFSKTILKEPSLDFIVREEGERTFYELCKAVLLESDNFKDIKGLSFKDNNGDIIHNQDRELIKNLDELPPVDYSLIEVKKYTDIVSNDYIMRSPAIGIVTSRGCPGRCVFCTVKAVWGRTWRGKSAERVIGEIESLYYNYGIREFSFLDDSVSLNKERWNRICDEIIRRKIDIRWTTPNGIAHWTLDRPTLNKMKRAGCYRITFGIESGSEQTRKFIGKPYPLSQARDLIRYANRIGMWTICTNIIGFPFETKEAIDETIEFAKKSGTDFATFYLLSPNFASDVYEYFEKEGLFNFNSAFRGDKFDEKEYDAAIRILNDGGFSTKHFTAQELKKMQIKAYRNFIIYRAITYLTILPLLRKIRSKEDLGYTLKLLFKGFDILLKSFYKKTTKSLLHSRQKFSIDASLKD